MEGRRDPRQERRGQHSKKLRGSSRGVEKGTAFWLKAFHNGSAHLALLSVPCDKSSGNARSRASSRVRPYAGRRVGERGGVGGAGGSWTYRMRI